MSCGRSKQAIQRVAPRGGSNRSEVARAIANALPASTRNPAPATGAGPVECRSTAGGFECVVPMVFASAQFLDEQVAAAGNGGSDLATSYEKLIERLRP